MVTTSHPGAPARDHVEGVHVHRIGPLTIGDWPVAGWPSAPWMAEVHAVNVAMATLADAVARRHEVDLVHAHDWMVGDAAVEVVGQRALPLVATVHATERGRHQGWLPGPLSAWVDARERTLAATARAVIVCSDAMAAQVRDHLGVAATAVIPNGVDPAPSRPPRPPRARSAAALGTLLFVGRLEHEKGVHLLLHAVAALRSSGRDVRLVVAGDGTQRDALEALATELAIDAAVHFAGFCDAAALADLHAAADVAVVPSLYEPFGLVALEAMAAGTPLVAARSGGLVEVVADDRTGLLVAPDDERALAAAVGRVLDDPALADRLRRGGLRRAATAGWPGTARRTAAVYAALAGSRRPGVDPL